MYVEAIQKVMGYTKPIKTISRFFSSASIIPGTATLFFINDEGWALTCRHVAHELINADAINQRYISYKEELSKLKNDTRFKAEKRHLERKYNLNTNCLCQQKINFDFLKELPEINIITSDKYDIAAIHFTDSKSIIKEGHAILLNDASLIQPGKMLCRLGYPFPEFNNFTYDYTNDDIIWTNDGNSNTPIFPIEGMITRHTAEFNDNGMVSGIEMSTPGLRGQSGGPLFANDGIVYGMQSATLHLHLGFDMKKEKMLINGHEEIINNQPFLHVGRCVHIDIIKQFLNENKIKYYTGNTYDNVIEVN